MESPLFAQYEKDIDDIGGCRCRFGSESSDTGLPYC